MRRRSFSDFVNELIVVTVVGLVLIQLAMVMELYVLAGMMTMTLVLASMVVMVRYYYIRKKR